MNKLSKVLNYFVFIFTTIAIAGVFYEGMSLEWFDIVGIFIIAMDVSFLISTLVFIIPACTSTSPSLLGGASTVAFLSMS